MSDDYVVMPKSDWEAILNAMRAKEGSSAGILSGELAAKIAAITTGITPTGTKDIAANGTYDVTNYSSAQVSVPVPSGYVLPTSTDAGGSETLAAGASKTIPAGTYFSGKRVITAEQSTAAGKWYSTTIEAEGVLFTDGTEYSMLEIYLPETTLPSDEVPIFAYVSQAGDDYTSNGGGLVYAEFVYIDATKMLPASVLGRNDADDTFSWGSPDWLDCILDGNYLYFRSVSTTSEQRQFVGRYNVRLFYGVESL